MHDVLILSLVNEEACGSRVPVLRCVDALRAAGTKAEAVAARSDQEIDDVIARLSASHRVRVSLRMVPADAATLAAAARRAQLPPGTYVCGLAARTPVLVGTCRPDLVSAIAASTAAMSTLSRHLSHLVDLLNRGSFRAAEEYVGVVAALPAEVRRHLALAAEGLAALQPPRERSESRSGRRSASRRRKEHWHE